MKKSVILLFTALSCLYSSAQKEITKDLEKFTEIKAFDRIEVQLIKSDVNKIVITGDERDEVEVSNKDGLLKIRMELNNHMDGSDILAKVYYTENLTLLDSNENAKIVSDDIFTGKEVRIAVQEAGKVILKIEVDKLDIKSTSGGEITLTGKAKTQEILANAGGKVFNEKLTTEETIVTANAGGSADVNASQKIKAKVRAGGTIDVYGNPKEIEKDKVFGGKITIKD